MWIICDVDNNERHHHTDDVRKWLAEATTRHRVAVSHPCIEAWFIYHFTPKRAPVTASEAEKMLDSLWPGRYKEGEVPSDLIELTDTAMDSASRYRARLGAVFEWPQDGETMLPDLIEYLDGINRRSGT